MLSYFDDTGRAVPVTVISFEDFKVSRSKSLNKDFIILAGKNNSAKKSIKSQLSLSEGESYRFYAPIEGESENFDSVLDTVVVGDKVNATSETKGKGFQSAIKRWKFAGGPRTHGQSDRERAPGSLGSRAIPGRVFKGKKMGGHMGAKTKTIKNIKVVEINKDDKYLLLGGSVPGPKGAIIKIVKK